MYTDFTPAFNLGNQIMEQLTCSTGNVFGDLVCKIHQILNSIIPILILLGVVWFVWGVVRYVISDSEEAKQKGKDTIIAGIIGLAVIIGLWGLVNIVVETFNLQASVPSANINSLMVSGQQSPNAPACNTGSPLGDLMCKIQQLLNSLIPILIALGVIYFIWGVVRYVIADSEEAKQKGKDTMIYGIIGFAVIVGLWGLVNILVETFNLKASAPQLNVAPLGIEKGSSCSIDDNSKLQDVLCYITKIINGSVIPLIFAVATVFFVWGAVKFFLINAGEEAQREQGRQFMIWGIIALAVMLSVWGLVAMLGSTFGIKNSSVLPQVQPSQR